MISVGLWGKKGDTGKSSIQLENEIRQLQLNIMTLNDQLDNFKRISFKYQDEYNKLTKKVNSFCFMILDDQYAKSQLGGHNPLADMDIFGVMDYAERQYREKNAKDRQLLIELTSQLKQKVQEIEGLKAQISRYMLKEQQLKDFGENAELIDDIDEPIDNNEEIAGKSQPVINEVQQKIQETKFQRQEERRPNVSNKPTGIMKMAVIEDDDDMILMPTKPIQKSGNSTNTASSNNQRKQYGQNTEISKKPTTDRGVRVEPVVQTIEDKVPADNLAEAKKINDVTAQKDLKNAETSNIIQSSEDAQINSKPQSAPTVIIENSEDAVIETIKTQVQTKTEAQKSNEIMAHIVNLNDYINNMNEIMWDVVMAIGKDGVSESKDIKKLVVNENVTESAFNTALSQLRKMHIIEQERINTGWRWFHAYELSDIGNRIYLEKTKKNPVECEKQLLKKEHTTALHGYCIKDTAYILKAAFGYDDAVTDRKANSMKLYSGETYIPDVIAKKKEGALVDYFEVELGHHTQKDFNAKCDKMRMVTKDLYFVVPDADTMNKTLARQIGQWTLEKGGKDKLKGTTIYLTTLTKLNEGKWENIYPF